MIDDRRISTLNSVAVDRDGRYALYWMQQSQRSPHNPALEYAIRAANELDVPLLAVFGLDASYPDANRRHFAFMLEGLAETSRSLETRGIRLVVRAGTPWEVAKKLAEGACIVVCDRGYLRHQRQWRKQLANSVNRKVVEVESDVVVPVETASDKREWAARTIRGKINGQLDSFLTNLTPTEPKRSSLKLTDADDIDIRDWRETLDQLDIDHDIRAAQRFRPGTRAAQKRLTGFLRNGLEGYAEARNDPAEPRASEMSPYLHFGQISAVEIALKVNRASAPSNEDKQAFLEELIVRRELGCNFVEFTKNYDSYQCLPDWARKTLAEHRDDERPVSYTRSELERGQTDDPYWNAAMREMLATGYMHNYMRMYWGKKILEWSNTPEYAYSTALYLNNKYFLDGRDPNSYSNVGWLFGLHDRAWTERAIFGKVRYMNARGLESKFDIERYIARVDELASREESDGG